MRQEPVEARAVSARRQDARTVAADLLIISGDVGRIEDSASTLCDRSAPQRSPARRRGAPLASAVLIVKAHAASAISTASTLLRQLREVRRRDLRTPALFQQCLLARNARGPKWASSSKKVSSLISILIPVIKRRVVEARDPAVEVGVCSLGGHMLCTSS